MGFAAGAVSFRRYAVQRFSHSRVDDGLLEALARQAFGQARPVSEDGIEVGWITPVHLFDVDFAAEKIEAGRFVHFRLRMDRTTAPAAIQRSYIEIERMAALEASDRDFLTKEEKRQAREAGLARAEKEAKSGAYRRISAASVLLDLENKVLYFGSTGAGANDHLMRLFAETFDASLEPINAHSLADRLTDAAGTHRAFEDAKPAHLVNPPEGIDGNVYGTDANDRAFLGREFLSWLWHRTDVGEGMFDVGGDSEVAATLVRVMQLQCDYNLTGTTTIRADGPTQVAEARTARCTGKQPTKMGLILASRGGEWTLTLDAVTLDATGVALPPSQEKDAIARQEERFESIAELDRTIDRLYESFLRLRFSREWPATLSSISQWAWGRSDDVAHQTGPRLATA